MAVAFESVAYSTSNDTSTVVTKPAGTSDGDLLLVALYSRGQTINSVPSGWTLVDSLNQSPTGDLLMYTYYKVAASEGSDWTWGWTGSADDKMWQALRFSGAALDTHSIANVENDDTPSWANGITPSVADSMLVMLIGARGGGSNPSAVSDYAIATDNPTWTERVDQGDGVIYRIASATGPRAATTATGNSSATITGASTGDHICNLIALAPRADVTVSPSVVTLTAVVNDPNRPIYLDTLTLTASVQTPTITNPIAKWQNPNKNTVSLANTAKTTAATYSNADKSSSSWYNTEKT